MNFKRKEIEKWRFTSILKNGLPTDRPTDRRTDKPSYRDAWTHLKSVFFKIALFLDEVQHYKYEKLLPLQAYILKEYMGI